MDTKELSYEFVTLRYLQEKAQKVILILGQTTMGVESHLQMKNKNTINVTFEMLITYVEYGFIAVNTMQLPEDHYLVRHALLTEQNHKMTIFAPYATILLHF